MMENQKNGFESIASYYTGLVDKYGHDPRACDYGRAESQATKFSVLSAVADLNGKSILDVGCGFADYFRYLSAKASDIHYVGLDITPAMIAEAKKLEPALDLRCANILDWKSEERFDVVTANGIFYLINENPVEKMRELVRVMFAKASIALAFNSLSLLANDKESTEFYADPIETLKFCLTLTPWVTLRHDYHSRDFTIYMYKDRNA